MTGIEFPIRFSAKDHEKVTRALRALGPEGASALRKIERAAKPANRGLKALDAGVKETRQSFEAFAGRLGPVGAVLSRLGPAGLAASAGLAAVGLGLQQAFSRARDAAAFSEELLVAADRIDLSAEAFQELTFVAEKFSVTQEALTDGLKELRLRADEFALTGAGSAAEAYKRLGLNQEEVNKLLADGDELFQTVIERMEELDGAARIRIADEVFGGQGGEQFVNLIAAGAAEIERLRQEARDLGLVMDQSLLERGAEVNRELRTMQRVIDTQLNAAFVDLGPVLLKSADLFADLAKWVGQVADSFRDIDKKTTAGLKDELSGYEELLNKLNERLEKLRARRAQEGGDASISRGLPIRDFGLSELLGINSTSLDEVIAETEARGAELLASIDQIKGELKARESDGSFTGNGGGGDAGALGGPSLDLIRDLELQISELNAELSGDTAAEAEAFVARLLDRLGENPGDAAVARVRELGTAVFDLRMELEAEAEAEKNRVAQKQEVERLLKRIATAEEQLAAEEENINKLLAAGAITAEQHARAIEEANERISESGKKTKEAFEQVGDAATGVFDDIIFSARSTEDALSSALSSLARFIAQRSILEPAGDFLSSSISSFTGSIFSEKGNAFEGGRVLPFARGGVISRPIGFPLSGGMTGIAGEAGPEAILPLKRMGDGSLGVRMEGGGGTSIFIDARGAGSGVSEEIRQAMREISAEQLRDAAPRIIDASVERQQDLARKGRLGT